MIFAHMADLHLDAPFVVLANKEKIAMQRRLEQRKAIKDIVEYIKENDIPYLFIAGDLYEQEYIRKSTIEYVIELFETIKNTKIFITPGNHDPYIKNSFYNNLKWPENVHIFKETLEVVELDDIDIYGYGFNDFYMENKYQNIKIKNPNKINILITHGDLDASNTTLNQYNPIKLKNIMESGFDYVALGHIHKRNIDKNTTQSIVYPGSTVSLGFDELGERGFVVGQLEKNKLQAQFIPLKIKTFEESTIDISELNSEEDLIQKLNEQSLESEKFYKIILTGEEKFHINVNKIMKYIENDSIIKLQIETKKQFEITQIANHDNLIGLFAKNILNKIENSSEDEKEKLLQAFEIGMEILNK